MDFIKDNNIKIGGHISFSKTLCPTIEAALSQNMNSIQFFMGNPKAFKRQRLSTDDFYSCTKHCTENNIDLFSHYPYTSSLVGSVKSLAWNGDIEQDSKTDNILKELEIEINTLGRCCGKNNRCGTVIHPGSFTNRDDGLSTIAKSINKLTFDNHSKLLLENCAGQGTTLPKDLSEFVKIYDAIESSKKENVGVVIDTAHVWGSGIYDLRARDEIDRLFHDFDRLIGLEKFSLLHLNDSAVKFHTKKDRHACLGDGFIWENDKSSLKYLVQRCGEYNIPIVLETPDVLKDMEIVRKF